MANVYCLTLYGEKGNHVKIRHSFLSKYWDSAIKSSIKSSNSLFPDLAEGTIFCKGNSYKISYKSSKRSGLNNSAVSVVIYKSDSLINNEILIGHTGKTRTSELNITIPDNLPEGSYNLSIQEEGLSHKSKEFVKVLIVANPRPVTDVRKTMDGLLGWFLLNSNTRNVINGGYEFNDVENINYVPDRNGWDDRGIEFGDTNAHVTGPTILGNTDFTMSLWLYSESNLQGAVPIYNGHTGSSGFGISVEANGNYGNLLRIFLGGRNANVLGITPVFPLRKWTYIAVTRKGSLFSLYMDSTLLGSAAG
ncbi:MAG: LamG-like jellyroll fold domain-containing protein, partial [Bacteroidota bacterium]